MDDFVEEITLLRLDCLDNSWIQAINYSEYLEYSDIPSEYEDVIRSLDVPRLFRNLIHIINNWRNDDQEPGSEKSWVMLNRRFPYNKLLALLGFYINNGTKKVVKKEHRNKAILASRLYFKLLSIPSYKSYQIYHSQLFVNALACLSFPKAMCEKAESYSSRELIRQVNSVIKELKDFVFDLKCVIEDLQLTPNDMCFEDVLSNLVDITGGAIVNKLDVDKIELANISKVIYEIINILLCNANREPNPGAIRLLFKCVLPKLIAACVDSRSSNNLVRASYVTYSGVLLSQYGKAAINGFIVMLEHLCYTVDGLERAEVRAARVSLVLGLMSLLPQKSHRIMVKWILKLSETAKNPHRGLAMEMMSKLLEYDPDQADLNEDLNNTVPELAIGNQNENAVENTENTDNQGHTPDVELVSGAVVQMGSGGEEEVAGLLRTLPHVVPIIEILRAFYARTEDTSSTLRARAYNTLADCVSSSRPNILIAIKKLNESGQVTELRALALRGVGDERAVVRRAAVALLHRLLERAPPPPTEELTVLKGLCRDASIIVRSAAIGAIAEMMVARPTDFLIDTFLTGPMHQISDPESKVQEQVLTLIQQLLIDRLKKYSAICCDDNLPWLFLAGIIRNNMRRHLQKACSLLAKKNNSVSVRLVDMVSTHLGNGEEEKDLQCLALLTSAAPFVEYNDLSFVIDYYYKLTGDETMQERDNRLMSLTLELLGAWSRFATTEQRTLLREHIVQRLAEGKDDGCRIASATLAAQLDPSNLVWATELMQLSERRAVEGGAVAEWLRAADLSMVAETPPSPALLQLFLQALTPPISVSEVVAGECVAGLGRLALRSREAADRAAPPLAALLTAPAAPLTARVNAVLVLSDICTRYTCIVEPLLECVCGCLAPASPPELRRSAARALTRLFLAGYLRLRTPLYFGFCSLLADEDSEVREPAEYYVTCCLTADAIYHHFVDCVLYYNKEAAGKLRFDARQLIYDVMLQRLSLVQRLNVQCRLAREVLEHAADMVDDGEDISEELNAALLDTITLLCGPRMKLPKKPEKPGEDIDDLQERVTTNIVSHKMKRTVAEVLVPAVLRLYGKLRAGGGQLAAYLVRIATDLLNDYRPEIEELIENDEELIVRVQHFQETIGQELSFGNSRNLVTTSAPPEPETPRAPRRRAARPQRDPPRKRALRI